MEVSDWIQLGGLAISALLFAGLIYELVVAARRREEDQRSTLRRETLLAWSSLSISIREVEERTQVFFGRSMIRYERALRFDDLVNWASEGRRSSLSAPTDDESAVIQASEALRWLLNAADDFALGVQVGAYDESLAYRVAGWRLARLFRRSFGYVQRVRVAVGSDEAWGNLDRFVTEHLRSEGAASDQIWHVVFQRPSQDELDAISQRYMADEAGRRAAFNRWREESGEAAAARSYLDWQPQDSYY